MTMDGPLLDLVVDRLAVAALAASVEDLVIAACEGQGALDDAMGGTPPERPQPTSWASTTPAEPLGAYLTSLTVEGFRGIGPALTVDFTPGPGLTVVAGRNGSGKSSLAEAFEILLTGENQRWAGHKTKVWQDGWRNLHRPDPVRIEADLAVEGVAGRTRISRTWTAGADLRSDMAWVQQAGHPREELSTLGWTAALATFRPFLSYNELGSMLEEGPSALFDTLSLVLGLDELTSAEGLLSRARLDLDKAHKAVAGTAKVLQTRLLGIQDDERARRAKAAMASIPWDLAAVEALVSAPSDADQTAEISILRRLTSIESPELAAIGNAATNLRHCADRAAAVAGTDAGRARDLSRLLTAALDHHRHHGAGSRTCPVCGTSGALGEAWTTETETHVKQLTAEAAEADAAHRALQAARDSARHLLTPVPAVLRQASALGIDAGELIEAWSTFAAGPGGSAATESDEALATHLEDTAPPVVDHALVVRQQAAEEMDRRNDQWRPLVTDLAAWAANARPLAQAANRLRDLKAAEGWMKLAAVDIRTERFQPIAGRAQAIWGLLRQQSNVDLAGIELEGANTRRRVTLDVTVDGVEGAALGVMSQGELHALALSLFLPRATLAESPFRFLVLDDPVQAMDPARVDGLAQVLEEISRTRQVIVLTHDDRLPEAVRRMGIPARMVEVSRKEGSVVTVRESSDPAHRVLADAFALAKTAELPAAAAARVVPGLLRLAVEAACTEVVRRRRIGRGEPHADVEELLADNLKLTPRLALALFDDVDRAGEVPGTVEGRFGRSKVDAYRRLNKGAHGGDAGDLLGLARNCEQLVDALLTLS
jgi:energy-coupling factor transporter ATP-binding protein EcfA2